MPIRKYCARLGSNRTTLSVLISALLSKSKKVVGENDGVAPIMFLV